MLRSLFRESGCLLRRTACHRAQTKCRYSDSYDGHGKTIASVLNNDKEMGLMINSFSEVGFKLNNNYGIIGPMVIFPRTVLQWDINSLEDIDEHSLSLLLALEPKLEVVIIGIGESGITAEQISHIKSIFKNSGTLVEILDTKHACSTFNFLNAEGRLVAGAFLTPKLIKRNNKAYARAEKRRKEIYGENEDVMKLPPEF